jgi:CRP-like cAMP-binding protein
MMPNRAEFLIGASVRMTPSDSEAFLRSSDWLSTVVHEFQSAFLRTCRWKLFERGETLVGAGDKSTPFIGIASGSVAITTALGAPDIPLTHIAHAGIWTGFVAFIGNRPTDNETVALTRAYAAVISRSAVEALLIEHPTWWRDVALATIANLSRNTTTALLGELERGSAVQLKNPSAHALPSGRGHPPEKFIQAKIIPSM